MTTERDTDPAGETVDAESERRRQGDAAVSGARWLTVAQMFSQMLRAAMNFVLVWFLTKGDYGRVGVAMIVLALVDRLADMGTGQAVIQREGLDKRTTDAVFGLNTVIGVVLAGLILVFAEPLAVLAGGPEAGSSTPLLRLLALSVLARSMGIVHIALLRRNLQFKKAAMVLMISAVVFAGVAVVLAIADARAWSIVIGSTAASAVSTVLAWSWSAYRPSLRVQPSALRSVAGFSTSLTATNFFNYLIQNLDRALVSRNLGGPALGLYALGVRILQTPIVMLTQTSNQVLIPVLSRNQDDPAEQRRRFLQATAGVALAAQPAMAGLAVVADLFTEVAFSDEWSDAGSIIRVMALVGMVSSVVNLASSVYVANARTTAQLINSICVGGCLIASYIITSRWSVEAVVLGTGLVLLVTAPFVLVVPFRILEMRTSEYLRAILPAAMIAGATAGAAFGGRVGLEALGAGAVAQLLAAVVAGGLTALAAIVVVKPTGYHEVERIIGLKGRRRARAQG